MIDLSKPYIYIESILKEQENLKVTFLVNGCASVNEAYVEFDGGRI